MLVESVPPEGGSASGCPDLFSAVRDRTGLISLA